MIDKFYKCFSEEMQNTMSTQLGGVLYDLAFDLKQWSEKTFGKDSERGPIGALKHLILEAQEAIDNPTDLMEYADCYMLILDAARRAGYGPLELTAATREKLQINKKRTYPKPETDEPSTHVN